MNCAIIHNRSTPAVSWAFNLQKTLSIVLNTSSVNTLTGPQWSWTKTVFGEQSSYPILSLFYILLL